MESLLQDLKYGFRTLARSPGFTAVAVLSLALGIGANTAIFTLTNAMFLNPLPVQDGARVMAVYTVDHVSQTFVANYVRTPTSYLNYLDFREQNNVFSGFAAFMQQGVTLTGHGQPQRELVTLVSANYFDVLGVKPALGRLFFPDEDQKPGANAVVVLSYSLWARQFGADPALLGRSITLNSVAYTVIGVTPPDFKGTVTVGNPEVVFIPISMHAQAVSGILDAYFNLRRMRLMSMFGRLKPGVDQAQAQAALKTIAARLEQEYPDANKGQTVELSSLSEAALGYLPRDQVVTASIALSVVVGLVLLIASVNLASLLLARSSKRTREMGIRTALGAERGRIIRQLLTESWMLSFAGGVVGVLIGYWGSRLLWVFRPAYLLQNSIALGLDLRVLAFTAGVTILTGLLFGLAPALRASVPNLSGILKAGGRGGTAGRSVLRPALVISEVAFSLLALIGAGLFIRSMRNMQSLDPGFETHNFFSFGFDISPRRFPPERSRQFFNSVLDKALSTPGVRSAGLASNPPLGGGLMVTVLTEGQDTNSDKDGMMALKDSVSPGYFDTVRIPLVKGRKFSDFDRHDAARVVVVNEAMARKFWPGQDAIGKHIRLAVDNLTREVVGVVKDSVTYTLSEQPPPVLYMPLDQQLSPYVVLHVFTEANPSAILPTVVARVQTLDENLALGKAATIQQTMASGLWAPRMGAALFGILGLLAMLLASIGIFGVMAYTVAQRTNEIGIRMALGARPRDILRLVVGQGMRLTLIGIGVGVLGALAVTRLMRTLLFNISPYDPLTFIAVSAVLATVAFLAAWLPARRAARIDPVLALQQE